MLLKWLMPVLASLAISLIAPMIAHQQQFSGTQSSSANEMPQSP